MASIAAAPPSLATFLDALLVTSTSSGEGRRDLNISSNALQRTIGTTATVGLSLFILRLVASALQAADEEKKDTDSHDAISKLLQRSEVFYQFIRGILRRLILQPGGKGKLKGTGAEAEEEEDDDNVPMIHKGSCHCRSVCFELIAPQKIHCKQSQTGKIQYRHARIRAKSFRFIKGTHLVKMYYVNKSPTQSFQQPPKSSDEVGAHSFCSRCGCHFLHAPNSHSTALDVNVDCLDQQNIKIVMEGKGNHKPINFSAGIPVETQWDQEQEMAAAALGTNSRYPATIAEETSPMKMLPVHFDNNNNNKTSPFAAYRHHPLMRHQNNDWDTATLDEDTGSISLSFPPDKIIPGTPSTSTTLQTESYPSSSGAVPVPPTLMLDTRDIHNDAESVVSLSSAKSCFPALSSTTANLRGSLSLAADPFGGLPPSTPTNGGGIASSTTPLVRHQMNKYMRKHMSSSSASSSSSSLLTPSSRSALLLKPRKSPSLRDICSSQPLDSPN